MSWPTALVLHPDCGRHDTGWRHPEHQGRLPAILNAIYRDTPALQSTVLQREGTHAPIEALLRVHSRAHVTTIEELAVRASSQDRPVFVNTDMLAAWMTPSVARESDSTLLAWRSSPKSPARNSWTCCSLMAGVPTSPVTSMTLLFELLSQPTPSWPACLNEGMPQA